MMKKSKKGVTLVELVICCAIIVLLGGACTAVLVSGNNLFNKGSASANAQMDMDVLQTYLMNELPRTRDLGPSGVPGDSDTAGGYLYFNDEGVFTLRLDGKDTTIDDITGFTWSIVQAGVKETSRPQFQFTATMADGSTISGGYVLISMAFDEATMGEGRMSGMNLAEFPFWFSSVAPSPSPDVSASPSPSPAGT